MRDDPFFYVIVAGCLIVLAILMVGVGGFAKGGEFNKRHGNKMMRWRVIAQFAVVVVLVGYVWLRSKG
jgi:hypothetical protein